MLGPRLWAVLALVVAGSIGCVRIPEEVRLTKDFAGRDTEYGRALARYTRKVELYEGFDTVAKAWATWRAQALRKALAEASVRAYGLEGPEADALRRAAEQEGRQVLEFHLALYTPKREANDLESQTSLWRLTLELPDGVRLRPIEVVHLPKTEKSAVEYPYMTPWTREYRVSFPRLGDEEPERLALMLAGPQGKLRFDY